MRGQTLTRRMLTLLTLSVVLAVTPVSQAQADPTNPCFIYCSVKAAQAGLDDPEAIAWFMAGCMLGCSVAAS